MTNSAVKPLSTRRKVSTGRKKVAGPTKVEVKPFSNRKANHYFFLFFLIMTFILYGNTLLNDYSIGDEQVTHNQIVGSGTMAIPVIFSTPSYPDAGSGMACDHCYQPITVLTFALEHELFGEKPELSHFFNVLIYFFLSLFLFFLLKRILNRYNILFPFLITLLFMAHPVHTEVVASLKNRGEMLAFICGSGSMWFLLNYSETRGRWHLMVALLLFFIGFLCNSSVVVFILLFPVVLRFYSGMPMRKGIPFLMAVVIVAVVAILIPRLFIPGSFSEYTFGDNPLYFEKNLWIRLGTSFMALLYYLKLLIYPVSFSYFYGFDMIPTTSLLNLWVICSLLIHGILFLFAIRKFRQKNILSFAVLWYLLAILPYSNLFYPVHGIVAERHIFTASLGFCIAVVTAVFSLFNTDPKTLTIEVDARIEILALIIIFMIPYTLVTLNRNTKWKNTESIFIADIEDLNKSTVANTQYASFLLKSLMDHSSLNESLLSQEEKQQTIILHLRQALQVYPGNVKAINALANTYILTEMKPDPSDTLTAISFWEQTAAKHPSREVYRLLGNLFAQQNDIVKSIYYDNRAEEAERKN